MIVECPCCQTRYELPVELPPEGRKVRCASCKHIWIATAIKPDTPEIRLEDFEDEEVVFQDRDSVKEFEAEAAAAAEEAEATPEPADAPAASAPAGPGAAAEDGDDDREFSDNDLEAAFSAAVNEVEGAEAGSGNAAAYEDENAAFEEAAFEEVEPEAPPIVIGKAKRRKLSMPTGIAAGWAALALFVAGVASLAYFQRVNVVHLLPGAAPAYERIGLPVNVRGLKFDKVKYSWGTGAGRPVLEVYGDIVNITSVPQKVPTVVFGLRTKEKVEVYQWAADVRSELLPAGQTTAFSAQIPTPPKSIRDVQVRFAKVR
jgi:predicted Zn finger-like uncharacterized protein